MASAPATIALLVPTYQLLSGQAGKIPITRRGMWYGGEFG